MKFHDVHIYAGAELATTGSRLELAAKNPFLRKIFSERKYCDGCPEPAVIIFPDADEDKRTLREAFSKLSHFKSGLSIIQSKYYINSKDLKSVINTNPDPEKVNSLLARLSLQTRTREPGQPSQLSASLERIINHAWEDTHQGQGEDGQDSGDPPGIMNIESQGEAGGTELFITGDLICFFKNMN